MTDNEIYLILNDGILEEEQPKTIEEVDKLKERIEGILENLLDHYKDEFDQHDVWKETQER